MTIWQQIAVCFYQNEIADGTGFVYGKCSKTWYKRKRRYHGLIRFLMRLSGQIIHMQRIFCTMKYRVNKKIKKIKFRG